MNPGIIGLAAMAVVTYAGFMFIAFEENAADAFGVILIGILAGMLVAIGGILA